MKTNGSVKMEDEMLDLRLDCIETECRKESSETRIRLGTQVSSPDYLYIIWFDRGREVWWWWRGIGGDRTLQSMQRSRMWGLAEASGMYFSNVNPVGGLGGGAFMLAEIDLRFARFAVWLIDYLAGMETAP